MAYSVDPNKTGVHPHSDSQLGAMPDVVDLSEAIKSVAFYGSDCLPRLHDVLDQVDPNIVRGHHLGTGNALHLLIRYMEQSYAHVAIQGLFDTLIARGVSLDTPCEDVQDGLMLGQSETLHDWIVERYLDNVDPDWWTDVIVPALLNAGAPWGDWDKRHDSLGASVRLHPMYIRQQLNDVVHAHRVNETVDPGLTRKPKI